MTFLVLGVFILLKSNLDGYFTLFIKHSVLCGFVFKRIEIST